VGPEFFVIDFTDDKSTALALCRRLRERGLAVARDIMSRPLAESLAYARDIRATRAVIIDHTGLARGEVRVVDPASGQEATCPLPSLMAEPSRVLEAAPGGALA
jgi:histidyl-tRNA synthetase